MMRLLCDLHIHTALSPCAGGEMAPEGIVRVAIARGLDVVAITDHNSAENVSPVRCAGEEYGLWVVPGIEVQTAEEVHVLGLFDTVAEALAFQEHVYAALPGESNREEFFGEQLVFDRAGNIVRKCTRLLLTSTSLSFEAAVDSIVDYGGIAIPAHVDRPAFSIIRTLGFVPQGAKVTALEVSPRWLVEEALRRFPSLKGFPLVVSSDAHRLQDIARGVTVIDVESRCFEHLREALAAGGDRLSYPGGFPYA